jgi:hypothetical protein
MDLRLGKIIIAIQRIKPDIKEEARKLPVPKDKAPRVKILFILRDYQIDIFLLEMGECFDDAIGRDDGYILQHQRVQPAFLDEVMFERFARVHY